MRLDSASLDAAVTFRELPLFECAHAWRSYWISAITPYIGADVLEVGAGIGSATATLAASGGNRWLCLEPDVVNFEVLQRKHLAGQLPAHCTVRHGDLRGMEAQPCFDTILYVDVLEHTADDRAEVSSAAALLKPGGRLVVLAPAYRFLFTEFDRAIGHYRRYSYTSLAGLTPPELKVEGGFYLDSVGMLASLGNRLVMRTAHPPAWSIDLWNRILVPASRIVDKVVFHAFGKTVVMVWRRGA
jgi:SAM-dependent methyltransferase